MKECQVANFHGQASGAYAYVWMMQGSLFSWITIWNLSWHTLDRCKVAYFHGQLHDSYTMQWIKECRVANFHGYHFGTNITHRSDAM